MNIHERIDNLSIRAGHLYGDRICFFREGIHSRSLAHLVRDMKLEFTPPAGEGEYQLPISYGNNAGTARYSLINWAGTEKPSLIFHHGSGETNYTARIKKILPKSKRAGINLFAISIPWNLNMKEYLHGIGSLERFCILIASSVRIYEFLGKWLRRQGSARITASGISLGGWITNLHFSLYSSMDEYRPIFAGAALDHLFTETVYRTMTSEEARKHPGVIKDKLNFENIFQLGNTNCVYPLLARHDQFIEFERQKGIYAKDNMTILERGHITGAMNIKSLRKHLLSGFYNEDGPKPRANL